MSKNKNKTLYILKICYDKHTEEIDWVQEGYSDLPNFDRSYPEYIDIDAYFDAEEIISILLINGEMGEA